MGSYGAAENFDRAAGPVTGMVRASYPRGVDVPLHLPRWSHGPREPLDIQPVGGGDAAVPVSRVLDRALLASEVRIDQAVSLCVPFRPLEIV